MNNQTEARVAIQSIRQLLAVIERQIVTEGATEQDLDVLSSLNAQAGRASDWLLRKTPHAPRTRVELPKETIARQELERELWPLAGHERPELIGGVSIG
jgi:hypothetical protein